MAIGMKPPGMKVPQPGRARLGGGAPAVVRTPMGGPGMTGGLPGMVRRGPGAGNGMGRRGPGMAGGMGRGRGK